LSHNTLKPVLSSKRLGRFAAMHDVQSSMPLFALEEENQTKTLLICRAFAM